jgi:hypothetical protein
MNRRDVVDARVQAAADRRERTMAQAGRRRDAAKERRDAQLERARAARQVSLVDLVDRLLDGGVVISGDITLAVADVDLLYVGLRALVSSGEAMERDLGISVSARSPALESNPS